ncbi:MAG: ribonuclease H-like YkuK family protein [Thermodesulfovibrionia bacterium]
MVTRLKKGEERGQRDIKDFFSPTHGNLSFDEVFKKIIDYIRQEPKQRYNLIIGSDSVVSKETLFVSAIVIHRVGHGGRYFYRKSRHKKMGSLRQRILFETSLSLEIASRLTERLSKNGLSHLPVEIHLDVGNNGDTKEIIKEVIGMVTGSGYIAVAKPDAYGASSVADRHSK